MNDLNLDKDYGRGSNGKKVKLIQEWLCLHGFNIAIDGDFGPATEFAVKAFQLASPQPLITTQMDWKGDFSQVIYRQTLGLRDVFECHMKAVELTLAIKTMIQEFWINLFKRVIVLI